MKNTLNQEQGKQINGSILLAVKFTLAGELTQREAVNIIQDVCYDQCGCSGYFRLQPNDPQFFTKEFVLGNDQDLMATIKTLPDVYANAVQVANGQTAVSLLILSNDWENAEEEYSCLTNELNEFLATSECLSWEQINLNEYPVITEIIENTDIHQAIREGASKSPEQEWGTIDINDIVKHELDIELDLDDVNLFGLLLAFFNNTQKMLVNWVDLSVKRSYTTVEISTGVLTKQDMAIFDRECQMNVFSLVASRHTGYFVKIPAEGFNEDDDSVFHQLSKQVQSIFMQAHAKGIQCVEFDCDVE